MSKTVTKLLDEISKLKDQVALLRQQLSTRDSINPEQADKIDALVVAHKKGLRIFTEKSEDKIYRILIEKMQEGALALTSDGTILYCNSYFAGMLGLPWKK